jgi:small subunit ribosomal protein S5
MIKKLKKKSYLKGKLIEAKKVTKVLKEGKYYSYRIIAALGNLKNKIGVGIGKNTNFFVAYKKALIKSRKFLMMLILTKNNSIFYKIKTKFKSSKIILNPLTTNLGIFSNTTLEEILELCSLNNISIKQLGSKNKLNNIKNLFLAFEFLFQLIKINKYQSFRQIKNYNKKIKKSYC